MTIVEVKTVRPKGHTKLVTLRGKGKVAPTLQLSHFALIGPGDKLEVNGSGTHIKLIGKNPSLPITVKPTYNQETRLRIGSDFVDIAFGEIESKEDLEGYRHLERFHYKGRVLDEGPENAGRHNGVGGRKAVILATIKAAGHSRVVGYIELHMPLMMCKPRHDLFVLPFRHSNRKIKWSKWLGDGQQHVNLFVRIARVVVDPEFRGFGISTMLVEHAKTFSQSRWSIGGERPLFIEISAEMLRYIDFVSKAGLTFIGNTEGNLDRISKDLRSIESGAQGKSQIMSLQRKYHAAFSAYCKKTRCSFDEARTVLVQLLERRNPRKSMPTDEWLAFRPILRFPIPYYVAGLDPDASAYLDKCLQARAEEGPVKSPRDLPSHENSGFTKKDVHLKISDLEIWSDQVLKPTPYVRLAMDSFGIDTVNVKNKLVGPVNIDLVPGNVALITGASGAGKSVLLEAILNQKPPKGLLLKGTLGSKWKTRQLHPLPEGIPLLQYFGDKYGPERAFDALCQVGLSEAMVFIKPFRLLSVGQRYRAMLADLILSNADIWLIDEFCSTLDPITAVIVSKKIKKLAQKLETIVIVAAANTMHFIDSLKPDMIYLVRTGGQIKLLRNKEYKNGFFEKGL